MTIFGWDASHYDWTRGPMDVAAAVRDGIVFMTHKIGEGSSYADDKFDDFYARARAAKVPLLGAYYVNRRGDQADQADRFLALLDAKAPGWRDGPFILQADCERWHRSDGSVYAYEPSAVEVRAFCDRLVARTGGRFRPLVYAPEWVYGDKLAGLPYPLWASAYGSNVIAGYRSAYPGDDSRRWGAYSGQTPAVLQYGSKTKIGSQPTCDANAFRGTLAELRALVSGQPEEDEMTPEELMKADVVPWDDTKNYTVGGALWDTAGRTLELLRQVAAVRAGQEAILGAVKGLDTRAVLARIDQVAQAEAARDAELPARLLAALPDGSGPVSREDLEAALRSVLGSVDNPPAS